MLRRGEEDVLYVSDEFEVTICLKSRQATHGLRVTKITAVFHYEPSLVHNVFSDGECFPIFVFGYEPFVKFYCRQATVGYITRKSRTQQPSTC
jgi:hypothetical protein